MSYVLCLFILYKKTNYISYCIQRFIQNIFMKQLCLVFHMLNLFLYTPRDNRCSIVTAHIDVFQQAFCMDKALEGFIFIHT